MTKTLPHTPPIDLLIIPELASLTPGRHLAPDEARQVVRDWHQSPLAGVGHLGRSWLVAIVHVEAGGLEASSTLRVLDTTPE